MIHVVTNRRVGSSGRKDVLHLLRRSYREGGKVRKETVGNLSHLPEEVIELVRGALRGERFVAVGEALSVERSLPAGHVEAALAMARRLELARLLERRPSRERALCLAMIVQRLIAPGSKLAMSRAFSQSTLAEELGVEEADEDELYAALDWLLASAGADRAGARPPPPARAARSSSTTSPRPTSRAAPARLAQLGYSRDGRRGTPADRLRAALRRRRPPGRGRGVRGLAARRQDAAGPDREAARALRAHERGRRLRPRHGHQGEPGAPARKRGHCLDHRAQGAAGEEAGRRTASCSSRSSTSRTWPRSPQTTTRTSGWSSAATRSSRASAPASARSCSQATERALAEIEQRVEQGTLRGEAAIGLAVGEVWNRWRVAQALPGRDRRQQPRLPAQPGARSPPRPPSTASTSSAPASPRTRSPAPDVVRSYKQLERGRARLPHPQGPARAAPDPPPPRRPRPRTRLPLHARLLPRPGTCATPGSRCSSTTNSRRSQPTRSPRHSAPRRPSTRRAANAPPQASPATRSRRSSPSSPPAPATRSASTEAAPPSTSSPSPPPPRPARSTSHTPPSSRRSHKRASAPTTQPPQTSQKHATRSRELRASRCARKGGARAACASGCRAWRTSSSGDPRRCGR